ncbi:hydroxypyruvate isomerase family protein [Vannielia litorea]|uniref:Hydroxypyruvate isomerase n=1 Tax=Vannielia litorea TaxID=1217970 RepID=A0A1N6IHG7_9RHOB|nr:TIM barrel protein [Vannielia litorea]SIO31477.1 hydroxypyruvate isomerase [Vannielia litorea]
MRFSANLGFLWSELPLPDAIRAARAAGFDAVECHWPYAVPATEVKAALEETGLEMLGLNASRGDPAKGEMGFSAVPGREAEARAAIDQALDYAEATGTGKVHVMAGFGGDHDTFVKALGYACGKADGLGKTILIEPINHYDAPGYFLSTTAQAEAILAEVGAENLKIMFDCYHVQLMEGDLSHRLERLLPKIGHIQIAAVPDRGAPDHGEVNFAHIYRHLTALGWAVPLGAEYKPGGPTEPTLGWLKAAQDI